MYNPLLRVTLPASGTCPVTSYGSQVQDDISQREEITRKEKLPLGQAYCAPGTLVILCGRYDNESHCTGEETESQREGVSSQVRLCLRTPVPEPALLRCHTASPVASFNSSANEPSVLLTYTVQGIEEENAPGRGCLPPPFGTSHRTFVWPWNRAWKLVFGRHKQTPLTLPEAINHYLLIDLIRGLSPHPHFQKKKKKGKKSSLQ